MLFDILLAALDRVTRESWTERPMWVAPLVAQSIESSALPAVDRDSDSVWLDIDNRLIAREIVALLERVEGDVDVRIQQSVAVPLELWRKEKLVPVPTTSASSR